MGAKVIAAVSSQEKADVCIEHGADEVIIYPSEDMDKDQQKNLSKQIKELSGGFGVNVVMTLSVKYLTQSTLRAIAWEGRYLVIGLQLGLYPNSSKSIITKRLSDSWCLLGCMDWIRSEGNLNNFEELLEAHADGKINPKVSDKFSLNDAALAIAHLKDRKAKGKVIINCES